LDPLKLPIPIIYEDNHLLVVNKPAGILVQSDRTGDESLLEIMKDYIKVTYKKPGNVFLGLPHRLDRPVSGVVVLAKTSKALERINEQFRKKMVDKIYWALTHSTPPEMNGKLTHWLIKDHKKNIVSIAKKQKKDAVSAELEYEVIGKISDEHLIEVKLITGRFHQIRVQLKSVGCPIVGDVKYGFGKPNRDGSICLHARRIHLIHPVKKEAVVFEADLPEKNWNNFQSFTG
jgi:23S rRNA pseudouridine1911/1915/1917 synthase